MTSVFMAICWLTSEKGSVNYFEHTEIVQVMCLCNMTLQEQQAKRNSWCPVKPHYFSAQIFSVSYLCPPVLTFTMHKRTLESPAFLPSSECIVKWHDFFFLFVWLAEHEYRLYDEFAYYFPTWRTSVILVLLKCIFKSHRWLQSWLMVNSSRTIKIN